MEFIIFLIFSLLKAYTKYSQFSSSFTLVVSNKKASPNGKFSAFQLQLSNTVMFMTSKLGCLDHLNITHFQVEI